MTNVSKAANKTVATISEAQKLYALSPAGEARKIGVEVETHIVTPDLKMVNAQTMADLQSHLAQRGFNAQLEAASVLEYASPAFPIEQTMDLAARVKSDIAVCETAVREKGLAPMPYPLLPTETLAEARKNMNDRERLQIGIKALSGLSDHGAVAVALLTAGVQVSLSPQDHDEMFRMAYRAYALTPLLMAATNADVGFADNDPQRRGYHIRGAYYSDYGNSGGISHAFLRAKDGATLVAQHCGEVFDALMYFSYAPDGSLIPSCPHNRQCFAGLPSDMKTQSNYELAESFLYHDVKICNLRDEDGQTIGKRLEIRCADRGASQPVMTPLMVGALIPDGPTADSFDKLLASYGFAGDPRKEAQLFLTARDAVVNHKGSYMDVAFGRKGRLLSFSKEVASLLDDHYGRIGTASLIATDYRRMMDVLHTGQSDALVFAQANDSFEASQKALRAHAVANIQRASNKKMPEAAYVL